MMNCIEEFVLKSNVIRSRQVHEYMLYIDSMYFWRGIFSDSYFSERTIRINFGKEEIASNQKRMVGRKFDTVSGKS